MPDASGPSANHVQGFSAPSSESRSGIGFEVKIP